MATLPESRGHKAVQLVASGALEHVLTVDGSDTQRLIPSCSREGAFYVTDDHSCTCPDATYRKAVCKHMQAIRIAAVLADAERANTQSSLQVVACHDAAHSFVPVTRREVR